MILTGYTGTNEENFKIKPFVRSRYGMRAVFFSAQLELARLYAAQKAKAGNGSSGGYVYRCVIEYDHREDFGGKDSYCPEFRSLIYRLYKAKHKAVLISGVVDYPTQSLKRPNEYDIIVVFDLKLIQNLRIVERNVRLK